MDLRQAVEKLPEQNVVHVTRQDSDGRRGFLWYVTFISIIGNAVPNLECETGVLNYNCDVSIVQSGTLPMSGNISIGHFSHVTRPLAFNSEADAIKMALENLPSTKGSVTVLRRSFSGPGENRMASNFRCVAGRNVGSLSVDTSKLSGTSVFSNVTIVEPGTSTSRRIFSITIA